MISLLSGLLGVRLAAAHDSFRRMSILHFLALRIDPHAQYEIRVYGDALAGLVRDWVPQVWEAFEDYRLGAVTFSRQMLAVVKRRLAGDTVTLETSGLSKREWDELNEVLSR